MKNLWSILILMLPLFVQANCIDKQTLFEAMRCMQAEITRLHQENQKLQGSLLEIQRMQFQMLKAENAQLRAQLQQKADRSYQVINCGSCTWEQARQDAEKRGGYLATITSEVEWQLILKTANLPDAWIWIGGTDQQEEGKWQWVTGEPWGYTRWSSGEPNNANNEDYLHIWPKHSQGGHSQGWNDWTGGAKTQYYLLEK